MNQEPPVGWAEALGEDAANPATPASVGETVTTPWCEACRLAPDCDRDGTPATACRHCGGEPSSRTWTVATLENRLKAQFEVWVRDRAKRAYQTERDADEADALRSVYLNDYSLGHYHYTGKHVRRALISPDGFYAVLHILLKRSHPELTEAQSKSIVDAAPKDAVQCLRWAMGVKSPNADAGPARKQPTPTTNRTPLPQETPRGEALMTGDLSPEERAWIQKRRMTAETPTD